MSFDLTNKNIQDTFQNLLQKTGSEGKLFDLVGNEITDLTIGGTLTAHSYITSESIVNTSSGSTAFGNSSDDTHQFIGHITASGNISASGDIIATGTGSFSDGRFTGFVGIGNGGSALAPEAILHLQNTQDDKYLQRWTLNNIEGGIFGDASGDVLKIQVNSNDALAFTTNATERVRIAKDGGTSFTSHITASGNISASGNLISDTLTAPTNNLLLKSATGDVIVRAGNTNDIKFQESEAAGGIVEVMRYDGGENEFIFSKGLDVAGNITASSNISASLTGSFGRVECQTISASSGQFDGASIFLGGEAFTRANIQTLKQGRTLKPLRVGKTRPDFEAEDGRFDGNITASGDIINTQVVQMTNSSSVINTFNTDSHKTCKYVLQVTSGSHIQSSEMLVMVSASTAINTEYAQINSGLNLLNFSSKITGENTEIIGSGSFISCSVKFVRTLI